MMMKKRISFRLTRLFWSAIGTFFLGLGAIGIFLPLMPTTPFVLLALACYLRGSEKMHRWLLQNRYFGKYLQDYQARKGVPWRIKIPVLSFLWLTVTYTAFYWIPLLWGKILLFLIATTVTIYLLFLERFHGSG